jgi:hypothetical protein
VSGGASRLVRRLGGLYRPTNRGKQDGGWS